MHLSSYTKTFFAKKTVVLSAVFGACLVSNSFATFSANEFADFYKGKVLIMALNSSPKHLNSALKSGIATGIPATQLFASLLRYDNDRTPKPYLAQSWKYSQDKLRLTMKLVRGARFHDGKNITSEDVAFSLKVVQANHPFKSMFASVKRVETPDAHTVTFVLSSPHPALLLAMSSQLFPILPKHIYDDGGDIHKNPRNFRNIVGSGPFKLVNFTRDKYIVLERNDDYFMSDPIKIDRLIMPVIKDKEDRKLALKRGEIHLSSFENNLTIINELREQKHLFVTDKGYQALGPITWLAFNTAKGVTVDKAVRHAIAHMIDRDYIQKVIMKGLSKKAYTALHPSSPFYTSDVERYNLGLNKANRILDKAGYKRDEVTGVRFHINLSYLPAQDYLVDYTKKRLKEIGIIVDIQSSPDFSNWSKRVANHDFNMTWDTVFNWGDPVIGVNRTYLSNNIRKGVLWSNTQGYSNLTVDKLIHQAGMEPDSEKRKRLYFKLQKILAEDLPVYWTHTDNYHTIGSKKIENLPVGLWGVISPMDKVYLK